MSLLAYAFGGGLAGVGEGLTKVGEHEQRMKGERLREAYWKKMEMARQGFQSGEAEKVRTFQSGEAEKGRTFQTGEAERGRTFQTGEAERGRTFQTGEAEKGRTFRSGEAEKGRTFQTGEAEKVRTFQTGEAEKGRTFQESENAAKRAAQGQKDKQARRADAKETAIKLSMEKDEFDQLVLNREIFGYSMNYWDTNEKFPYQRPVSWDDIKIVADFEKIPLMQARDYMKRLGHPVPVGDPPSHLTNPGDKLWPGRKR